MVEPPSHGVIAASRSRTWTSNCPGRLARLRLAALHLVICLLAVVLLPLLPTAGHAALRLKAAVALDCSIHSLVWLDTLTKKSANAKLLVGLA